MTLEQIIDIADQAYPDGFIRLYFDEPDGQHGDTLAKFIVLEIKETYDADTDDTAQLRVAFEAMLSGAAELDKVGMALMRASKHD
jgi:hypothetical protein